MPNTCLNNNNISSSSSSPTPSSNDVNSQKKNNNANKPIGGYKDVVIIGNGPSGLCLSYFLSGYWPYWNKTQVNDECLQTRLEYSHQEDVSLCEQDLQYLSDGLEGRTVNPVALLYDSLHNPGGDLGLDLPTCLSWGYDPLKEVDHVVIGKGQGPGGSWNNIDGSQLTISPSRWMELPDYEYNDWDRQRKVLSHSNAGLVFSSTSSHFSEDKSLLNANSHQLLPFDGLPKVSAYQNYQYTRQSSLNGHNLDNERVTMHDVRNYYRDYAKSKNLDRYMLNNATVTSVKRISCPLTKLQNIDGSSTSQTYSCWEVTGLIDRRDKKKASSCDRGDLMEFRFVCRHLVLANGATDLHNELGVKGENLRFILRSIRELEDKIQHDLQRLRKDPLLIVGSGLSAADAILLAQKYRINIIHVIRRNVRDPNLIFSQLPKNVYPEYHRVYEQMKINRYCPEMATNDESYVLYDQYQVKCFTSKRTCILKRVNSQNTRTRTCSASRHLHTQKQHQHHHHLHQLQLDECEEEEVTNENCNINKLKTTNTGILDQIELKLSYACILIGFAPDLSFLPSNIVENLALNSSMPLDTKENPIAINSFTHESIKFKHLFAMGPLVGDNFVRFGTGGALAICSRIWRYKKYGMQRALSESSSSLTKFNNNVSNKLKKKSSFNLSTLTSTSTEI